MTIATSSEKRTEGRLMRAAVVTGPGRIEIHDGVVAEPGPGQVRIRLEGCGALSYHAYATHDIAEADAVVVLPDALRGRPFPAEPLGCAMNIFARSGIRSGDTVAIVGIGFLGALLTQLATAAGARVIAIGRRAFALDLARQTGAS